MSTLQVPAHSASSPVTHELCIVMEPHRRQAQMDKACPLTMRLCTVRCSCGQWIRSYWNVKTAEALSRIAADAEEHLRDDNSNA